jgi:hypothetical protein
MLPFRSGRAGFSGACSAFLLLALLSCAAFAGKNCQAREATINQRHGPSPRKATNILIAPAMT